MAKPKQRLVADPSIGVTDLLQCVECWLDEKGTSNLLKELEPPSGTGWKTAVDPSWVAKLGGLWKKFIAIAPNGVIPSKKNRTALEKLQSKQVRQPKMGPKRNMRLQNQKPRLRLCQTRRKRRRSKKSLKHLKQKMTLCRPHRRKRRRRRNTRQRKRQAQRHLRRDQQTPALMVLILKSQEQ